MRIATAALLSSFAFIATAQAPKPAAAPNWSGTWLDSQSNRISISDDGVLVKLSSAGWSFDTGKTAFTADLKMAGLKTPGEFSIAQPSAAGTWQMTLKPAANGSLRGTLQSPDSPPLNFILVRESTPPAVAPGGEPEVIVVKPAKLSAAIGRWIPLSVTVARGDGTPVSPDADIFVDLEVSGGTPLPGRVRLTSSHPNAPAGINIDTGEVSLKASSPGLRGITINAWGCAETPVVAIRISSTRSDALATGKDAVPLLLKFVDANGSPSNNRLLPKSLDWRVEGATRRTLADRRGQVTEQSVPPDECVSMQEITSDRPGQATVAASFASWHDEIRLRFHAPLTALAIAIALLGGLLGGLVAATGNYKAAIQWKAKRWAAWLLAAATGAIALFLAWHYGIVSQWVNVPSGKGFAFLAGMVGGFAGGRVLAAFADSVLEKSSTARAHPA
jgi:hypothetical protein